VRFEKWQALGNDYMIVERGELPFALTAARITRLCAPHVGVGSDGVLVLSAPAPGDGEDTVARLRIFNPDGSEAELSGNGAREAVLYLRRRGRTDRDRFTLHTVAGPIVPTITGPTTCTVDMGQARTVSPDYPGGPPDGTGTLRAGGRDLAFRHVSIGNPQCAILGGSEIQTLDLPAIGPGIERDPRFPNRTNVSFVRALDAHTIRARIFERGVGETLASGTGACGAAVAHVLDGGSSPVTVRLDGGELTVEVDAQLHVKLTGWAVPVFAGELSEDLVKELHETE
jgi:diaminopimelate epimerase